MFKSIYENFLATGILLIMASCAHGLIMSEITPGSGITRDFQYLVDKFNILAEQHVESYCQPNIDVGYGNLKNLDTKRTDGNTTIGVCISSGKIPMILFDRSWWSTASETEKEMVAFHEFGHCILDLDHNDKTEGEGWQKHHVSLMAPVLFTEQEYAAMYDYYIAEMFAATKLTPQDWKEGCKDAKDQG